MKTIKRLLKLIPVILVLLLFTIAGYTNSPDITERVKSSVNKKINYPEFAKSENLNGMAVVNYTVQAVGLQPKSDKVF